jgi:hypothetical protein
MGNLYIYTRIAMLVIMLIMVMAVAYRIPE